MSRREEIEGVLREHKPILHKRFKVDKIGLFGSYARGEDTEQSDVDILVDFSQPVGWEFIDLKEYLEEIIGKRVDLATMGALKRRLKDVILKEVRYQ